MSELKKIIFIAGPTAVGKSNVAFNLAKKIGGEIVSCDSMQVYKEISIASNKPSKEERQEVVHYLVDIVSVEEEFDVARFNELAINAIDTIHAKGLVPIIVGGSGLYMQILLDGIFKGGASDIGLRDKYVAIAKEKGNEFLYSALEEKDPEAARKIHPNDLRRIVRSLEVCEIEKCKHSDLKIEREGLWGKYDISIFVLNCEREILYDRINKRAKIMIDEGLVCEVKALGGLNLSKTASGLIGVKEVLSYLEGECALEEVVEVLRQNTRRYAKRQLTWFRREKRAKWIEVGDISDVSGAVSTICNEMNVKVE